MSRVARTQAPSARTDHLLQTRAGQPARQSSVRVESPSKRTNHLLPTSLGQPARQVTPRVGNVASQSFITRNPGSQTVYRSGPPAVIVRPERNVVVVKDRSGSCWAKFLAFLALIFCCGLLTKPYRG
jgi:hypothetical protein